MEDTPYDKIKDLKTRLYVMRLKSAYELARHALEAARDADLQCAPYRAASFDVILAAIDETLGEEK